MEISNLASDLQCEVVPSAWGYMATLRKLDVGEILDRVWFTSESDAESYARRAVMGWVD